MKINNIKYIVENANIFSQPFKVHEKEQNVNVQCTYFQNFKYDPDILTHRRSVKVHCCGIYVNLKF